MTMINKQYPIDNRVNRATTYPILTCDILPQYCRCGVQNVASGNIFICVLTCTLWSHRQSLDCRCLYT